jgi:hypothetical protein
LIVFIYEVNDYHIAFGKQTYESRDHGAKEIGLVVKEGNCITKKRTQYKIVFIFISIKLKWKKKKK